VVLSRALDNKVFRKSHSRIAPLFSQCLGKLEPNQDYTRDCIRRILSIRENDFAIANQNLPQPFTTSLSTNPLDFLFVQLLQPQLFE
jgi:hypothetical protein